MAQIQHVTKNFERIRQYAFFTYMIFPTESSSVL